MLGFLKMKIKEIFETEKIHYQDILDLKFIKIIKLEKNVKILKNENFTIFWNRKKSIMIFQNENWD